jgi:CheY-like chemotaxis protein
MSHELRTPLTAILGFSQLLEMDDLTDDQRTSVSHILKAGRHLLDLINEILDISRIETGQMTISAEPVAVAELLEEVVAVLTPLAGSRRVQVGTDIGRGAHVMADRNRLRQVLTNVLSNAIKYNREGGTVSIACGPGEEGRLRIAIRDTGYGISPEHLDRVFRPFDRLGAELGTVEGTGIGLALASGLVAAMGGSMRVESQLDAGSTFTIDLALAEGPLERYERTATADPLTRGGPRRVVLQIEDNQSNVKLVERIMQRRPAIELLTAPTGRSGLQLAASRLPNLVLLDLHLPDLPGHEVLRELKLNTATRHIPVVVVSADATSAQVSRLQQSGVFGYLTKPLDVAEFLATVDRAVLADEPEPIA